MSPKGWIIAILCICSLFFSLQAQTVDNKTLTDSLIIIQEKDTLLQNDSLVLKENISIIPERADFVKITTDSILAAEHQALPSPIIKADVFTPSPRKAVLYAAAFPGLGQIYNRKYWKLPIVYGGFMGCAYAIIWNNRYYSTYQRGYLDIMDDDEATDSWKDVLNYWQRQNIDEAKIKWLKEVFKKRKDYYRYYRDLSIIATIGLYALCIIDAYVDAQLYDFDISSDLSMHISPTVLKTGRFSSNAFGLQCCLSF